jgi:transcriptional regulator with XRE-family HTH domain
MFNMTERLREHIDNQGLTLSLVAQKSEYSKPYIRQLFSGARPWSEAAFHRVCEALGLQGRLVIEPKEGGQSCVK